MAANSIACTIHDYRFLVRLVCGLINFRLVRLFRLFRIVYPESTTMCVVSCLARATTRSAARASASLAVLDRDRAHLNQGKEHEPCLPHS